MIGTFRRLWRRNYYRLVKTSAYSLGRDTTVLGRLEVRKSGGRIEIGKGCLIEGRLVTETSNSRIVIKDNVFVGGNTLLACVASILIEDDAMVSYECILMDSNNHSFRFSERRNDLRDFQQSIHDWGKAKSGPIRILRGGWIGARSIILKGVTIGEGSIVGAGSVVTKDIPDWVVAAGNPARVIRKLGPDER